MPYCSKETYRCVGAFFGLGAGASIATGANMFYYDKRKKAEE